MIPAEPVEGAAAASLVVSDAELTALLALARGGQVSESSLAGVAAAGWIVDGAPVGVVADGLAAIAAPLFELALQRGARRGEGAADEQVAALIVPAAEPGAHRLIVAPTQFLPDLLGRLNDVSPRPPFAPDVVLRYDPGDLARILAGRDAALAAALAGDGGATVAARLVEGLREHWRVETRWAPAEGEPGRRAVEVLDTNDALWRVVPDGGTVALRPSTPTAVFRELTMLLPRDAELAALA